MNNEQKEVLTKGINDEKLILKRLQNIYSQSFKDVNEIIKDLQSKEQTQSVIYQLNYQKQLKKQLQVILEKMIDKNYKTIDEYLQDCYENGFLGVMYDIHNQGVPIILPIDQSQVVDAIQNDTKLSTDLYTALGKDVTVLNETIKNEISRGISTSMMFGDISRNIDNVAKITFNRAYRIARTEGHRIQQRATHDAQIEVKKNGADIVKQWDSTLDSRTRETHKKLDGQLIEVDEYFEINGKKARFPGDFGVASEDINCRCVILQRAKWALDEDELEELNKRAEYFGLDKSQSFNEFKTKYLEATKKPKFKIITKEDVIKLRDEEERGIKEKLNKKYDEEMESLKELRSFDSKIRKTNLKIKMIDNRIADRKKTTEFYKNELEECKLKLINYEDLLREAIKDNEEENIVRLRKKIEKIKFEIEEAKEIIDDKEVIKTYEEERNELLIQKQLFEKERDKLSEKHKIIEQELEELKYMKNNPSKKLNDAINEYLKQFLDKLPKTKDNSSESALKNVNPNFSKGREYEINCQRCAPTYEMYRRGYDVEALPNLDSYLSYNYKKVWREVIPIKVKKGTRKTTIVKNIKKLMLDRGEGTRCQIRGKWTGINSGHTFNAEVINGEVKLMEAQAGIIRKLEHYIEEMDSFSIEYFITNDLELNWEYADQILKGREKQDD